MARYRRVCIVSGLRKLVRITQLHALRLSVPNDVLNLLVLEADNEAANSI